jgi:hypothetical protein
MNKKLFELGKMNNYYIFVTYFEMTTNKRSQVYNFYSFKANLQTYLHVANIDQRNYCKWADTAL